LIVGGLARKAPAVEFKTEYFYVYEPATINCSIFDHVVNF
jgi:hypothetical protein